MEDMNVDRVVTLMSEKELEMQQEKIDKLDQIVFLLKILVDKLDDVANNINLIERHTESVSDKR